MLPQKRFYVTLDRPDFERLAAEARKERRDVRDQAAVTISRALGQPLRRGGDDDPPHRADQA